VPILTLLLLLLAAPALAQGLPPLSPINPVAVSRSGLAFVPYHDSRPGRWTWKLAVDYASTIEANEQPTADYLLDSELLRVEASATRDLGAKTFLLLEAQLGGAYDGFMDGFLDWYHDLLGIEVPERERRPHNEFFYGINLDDGTAADYDKNDLFLGDTRVGLGVRLAPWLQSVAALTLPTSTGPEGYGRGVVSVNLINTFRSRLSDRFTYEGSLSGGYTPSHGPLSASQREVFAAATSGLRFRFWGRQSLYANFFYHSPYYEGTSLPSLDEHELSLDFGWLLATAGGAEWRLGMTEDLVPRGPGIDLVFRLGVGF
jgi:hypothetical protein